MHSHSLPNPSLSTLETIIAYNDMFTVMQYWLFAAVVFYTFWKLRKYKNQAWLTFMVILATVFAFCASTGYLPEAVNYLFGVDVLIFKVVTGSVLNIAAVGLNFYLIYYNALAKWAVAQEDLRVANDQMKKELYGNT